jgi:hypothetical protein
MTGHIMIIIIVVIMIITSSGTTMRGVGPSPGKASPVGVSLAGLHKTLPQSMPTQPTLGHCRV